MIGYLFLNIMIISSRETNQELLLDTKLEKKEKQAGAELCQAQVKLGWPASSFSLRFKFFMSLKIVTYTLIDSYSKKIMVSQC
jgi:hypothetical protein